MAVKIDTALKIQEFHNKLGNKASNLSEEAVLSEINKLCQRLNIDCPDKADSLYVWNSCSKTTLNYPRLGII